MAGQKFFWRIYRLLVLVCAVPTVLVAWFLAEEWATHPRGMHSAALDLLSTDLGAAVAEVQAPVADYSALCRRLSRRLGARVLIMEPEGRIIGDSGHVIIVERLMDHEHRSIVGAGEVVYDESRKELYLAVDVPLKQDGQTQAFVRAYRPVEEGIGRWLVFLLFIGVGLGMIGLATRWLVSAVAAGLETAERRATSIAPKADDESRLPQAVLDPISRLNNLVADAAFRAQERITDLDRQTRQWETLVGNMREGLLVVDHEFRFVILNPAARQFLGLAPEVVLRGRPTFEVLRNPDLNRFIRGMMEGDDQHSLGELEARAPRGATRWYRLSGTRFQYRRGEQQAILIVLHDITRLKHLEHVRRDFVANVSHELKTPLTAVRGYVEALEDAVLDDPELAQRFVSIICGEADRLNAIIEDLLTLSRLEQGEQRSLEDTTIQDLAETALSAIRRCQSQLDKREIVPEVDLCPCPVRGQHGLIEQAIYNLVDNAVKYNREDGTICIRLSRDGETAWLEIEDEGIGIPNTDLERIFERFYRVDKSRDRATGGTGLGLSIVRHIMRLHGGTVHATSSVGTGSIFTIELPVADTGTGADAPA